MYCWRKSERQRQGTSDSILKKSLSAKQAGHRTGYIAAQAYECLAILEGTSSMAQQALESNAKLKRDDSRNISAYFNKVALIVH